MIVSISRLVFLSATVSISMGCTTNASSSLPQQLNIEVTGSDFEWHVRYAGPDETFQTPDDYVSRRNITLMTGIPTTIFLKSNDYVYSFALPHLGLKEIAVPDLDFSLDFCPETLGEFTLKGDQLCGYQHPNLIGKVNVVAPREFLKWRDGIISEQRGRQHD